MGLTAKVLEEGLPQDGTSGVNGGGEIPFQVFPLVPGSHNHTIDNSYTLKVGGGMTSPPGPDGGAPAM
jgi:hypothetical protein